MIASFQIKVHTYQDHSTCICLKENEKWWRHGRLIVPDSLPPTTAWATFCSALDAAMDRATACVSLWDYKRDRDQQWYDFWFNNNTYHCWWRIKNWKIEPWSCNAASDVTKMHRIQQCIDDTVNTCTYRRFQPSHNNTQCMLSFDMTPTNTNTINTITHSHPHAHKH